MTRECYESGNRRAEIDGGLIRFLKVTGRVRKSAHGVWKMAMGDLKKARRLARRWVFKGLLGDPVLR